MNGEESSCATVDEVTRTDSIKIMKMISVSILNNTAIIKTATDQILVF